MRRTSSFQQNSFRPSGKCSVSISPLQTGPPERAILHDTDAVNSGRTCAALFRHLNDFLTAAGGSAPGPLRLSTFSAVRGGADDDQAPQSERRRPYNHQLAPIAHRRLSQPSFWPRDGDGDGGVIYTAMEGTADAWHRGTASVDMRHHLISELMYHLLSPGSFGTIQARSKRHLAVHIPNT